MQGLEAKVSFFKYDGYSALKRGEKVRNDIKIMVIAPAMLFRRQSPGLGAELTWPR